MLKTRPECIHKCERFLLLFRFFATDPGRPSLEAWSLYHGGMSDTPDLARVRHDNALRLFDEFVQANVRSADAATLRGLERRFAERLQIQPSYWSQIKARSRQIGERLARQFERLCRKPAGWMDLPQDAAPAPAGTAAGGTAGPGSRPPGDAPLPSQPMDDDERFIIGLVLTYYRRHPQRARARLLDLLGEVLIPADHEPTRQPAASGQMARPATTANGPRPAAPNPATDDDLALWQRSQAGVAPLSRKR